MIADRIRCILNIVGGREREREGVREIGREGGGGM